MIQIHIRNFNGIYNLNITNFSYRIEWSNYSDLHVSFIDMLFPAGSSKPTILIDLNAPHLKIMVNYFETLDYPKTRVGGLKK